MIESGRIKEKVGGAYLFTLDLLPLCVDSKHFLGTMFGGKTLIIIPPWFILFFIVYIIAFYCLYYCFYYDGIKLTFLFRKGFVSKCRTNVLLHYESVDDLCSLFA